MYDVIVIGAGVAGMSVALSSLRNGKSVCLFEGTGVGGQIANSPKVENFPTIKSISGSQLADIFMEQIDALGVEMEYDEVTSIEKVGDVFTVKTNFASYEAKSVVAAVGVKHKHINVPGEKELSGKGVYYCALCDGPFYKDKEVALIGDGNTAMQYAILLSGICTRVNLLTWTDKFFGDKALEEVLKSKSNIVHMPNTAVTAFKGNGSLEGVEYTDKITGESKTLSTTGVFVAIGQLPDNKLFASLAQLDEEGYFIANEDMSTSTAGFFVAGDCRAKKVRQLTTAISDGAIAALSACNYIEKL